MTKNTLEPCPICGEKPDYLMGNLTETEFKVGCSQCHVFTVAPNGKRAQEMWNEICSKEVEEEPELVKPCPFCGTENLNIYYRDVDDRYNPFDPCVRCNVCGTVFKFRDGHGDLDDIQKVWNRRVKE